ncbi:hypothetical protein A3G56_01165 [Candidatus Falkowbacteria bacterium RIFCSPLOWO2_12_FULL_45_10]|uniref:Peptidase C39-like domain-containing protein n=1 Tax=Candidatus Falkowbacteria bacterium RIFCSPLOWO2_12_FULL_45_10 TaxID=1797990 RepID=A0A1F5RXQ4_9BACT|nr:MAG: hypothetical protein A3G56_01165 [Candidatus Falkowbacteria bacterium RIFCSPLOWO2_12_FULL_45_10]
MLNQKPTNYLIISLALGCIFIFNTRVLTNTAVAANTNIPITVKQYYLTAVPFVPQAPFGEWKDKRFQDGCEEATSIIAVAWAQKKSLTKTQAKQEMIKIAAYEQKKFGGYADTSAADTLLRIIKGYFNYQRATLKKNITVDDIIAEIKNGYLIIAPFNGQKLKNPYYTAPGPERHMIIIRGYDETKNEFITNDVGTRRGENYRYPKDILFSAIRDYPTGNHQLIKKVEKNIIVVKNN